MKLIPLIRKTLRNKKGVTLIEMIVIIGILMTLLAIGLMSISNLPTNTTVDTDTTLLISDVKNQQIKSMTGDTEGQSAPANYGVKIFDNNYVLFHGSSYDENDPENRVIQASSQEELSTTFPDQSIIFSASNGEILNFSDGQNTISIQNLQSSEIKTLEFNKYGAIISQ